MKVAGIGTMTLSKLYENQRVSIEVLIKICKVFGCDIATWLTRL